jgi:uncharacterized protein
MRIVLDTNILARATPGRNSPAEEVLFRSLEPPHALLVSAFLLDELDRVLRYDRLREIHGLDDAAIGRYVQFIQQGSQKIDLGVPPSEAVVPNDPDDDPILATAVLGQANVLATRDRDLRRDAIVKYAAERGVRIITELELLDELRREQSPPPKTPG